MHKHCFGCGHPAPKAPIVADISTPFGLVKDVLVVKCNGCGEIIFWLPGEEAKLSILLRG